MSQTKSDNGAEPFPLPAAAPAPLWVVLEADFRDVPAGRCVRVAAGEAEALIGAKAARRATPTDLSIGASLARDLS